MVSVIGKRVLVALQPLICSFLTSHIQNKGTLACYIYCLLCLCKVFVHFHCVESTLKHWDWQLVYKSCNQWISESDLLFFNIYFRSNPNTFDVDQ